MQGVLEGFATLAAVIALGALLAHLRVLDTGGQLMLSRLAFFVASPALMATVLADADVDRVFSRNLLATASGVLVGAVLYCVVARWLWHRTVGDTVIGTLSAVYVNAGNLGIPIAAYVLGDGALAAPTLLMQVLLLQPVALAVLDHDAAAAGFSLVRTIRRPFTNPLTLGSLVGLFLALSEARLPTVVAAPVELVAGMAVPAMLLAYGVSLRLGPRPGEGGSGSEIAYIAVLKLVAQPAVAFVVGRYLLDLGDAALLGVTVLAALPTAQNIFVHATRYDRGVVVARDAIFVTTLLSVPAVVVVAALLGA